MKIMYPRQILTLLMDLPANVRAARTGRGCFVTSAERSRRQNLPRAPRDGTIEFYHWSLPKKVPSTGSAKSELKPNQSRNSM